jgi:hypothetical protein
MDAEAVLAESLEKALAGVASSHVHPSQVEGDNHTVADDVIPEWRLQELEKKTGALFNLCTNP